MRGMASENEYPLPIGGVASGSQLPEEDDDTSKLIRDEAIKTWNLGNKLGISSNWNDGKMVDQLVNLELAERKVREQGKEQKANF